MAKVTLRNNSAAQHNIDTGSNTPATVSLVSGILGWLILPFIAPLVAIITGHIGRKRAKMGAPGAGAALAGLILGYLWWLLLIPMIGILAAIALPAYQDYVMRVQQQQAQQTGSGEQLNQQLDALAAGNPAHALNEAKMTVAAKLSKGAALNQINEALDLDAGQKQHWQQVSIEQGTVYAVPAGGGDPLLLLSMQNGNQLVWVCGGNIPPALAAFCSPS